MVFTNIANMKAACFEDEGERRERKKRGTERERERERENTQRMNARQTLHAARETRLSVSHPVSTTFVNMNTASKPCPFTVAP